MSNLLFEIGTEELPAGYIEPALQQLRQGFEAKMMEQGVAHGLIRTLATPRRLTLIVEDLAQYQHDWHEEIMGPSVKAAYDNEGKPTKAAQGFARSKGATAEDLQVVETAKGEYLVLVRENKGQPVSELLPDILKKLVVAISFPKTMRWGSNSLSFARPIQWLLALNGSTIVDVELEGIQASNTSGGHRFLNNYPVKINDAADYEEQLAQVNVMVDPKKRKNSVLQSIEKAVADSAFGDGARVHVDEELLDTVTNLVELPCGVCGRFDDRFLSLPDEVLITSMKEHQKYFPVVDGEGKLLAGFVAVNNTRMEDETLTRQGHERVLRARLEDALFFFKSDQNYRLDDFIPALHGSVFQAKLGTMHAKAERMVKLTRMLAEKLEPSCAEDACRAAQLCKADLLTEMVGEFPSLQGIMGHAYAVLGGEKENVALAIKEHYMPKRADAQLPGGAEGTMVGMADRLDTLAGCFGIGQIPSGTADPFGLRRISLALLHIIEHNSYGVSLREVVHKALALYGDKVDGSGATVDAVVGFIKRRYRNDCITAGFDAGAVDAGIAAGFDDVNDCSRRIRALGAMQTNAAFSVLAGSYKRIKNIIKDHEKTEIQEDLLIEHAEKSLHSLFKDVRRQMEPMLAEGNYLAALEAFLELKEPVDTFFDEVMVMDNNEDVRCNRLNLLTALGQLVLRIGDISRMQES
ncbi:MAG: glycine--tRNA ligase subunit beta [Desulfopila sp.]